MLFSPLHLLGHHTCMEYLRSTMCMLSRQVLSEA
uniref:Uncharacterized protein n=1 Tax=Glossina morsitans morsitans TaxID=37546 RepID=A0A1B0FMI5_GLOMM